MWRAKITQHQLRSHITWLLHGRHMVNVHSPGVRKSAICWPGNCLRKDHACDVDICKVYLSAIYHENLMEASLLILEHNVIFHEIVVHNSYFAKCCQTSCLLWIPLAGVFGSRRGRAEVSIPGIQRLHICVWPDWLGKVVHNDGSTGKGNLFPKNILIYYCIREHQDWFLESVRWGVFPRQPYDLVNTIIVSRKLVIVVVFLLLEKFLGNNL